MKVQSTLGVADLLLLVMFITLTTLQLGGFSNDPGVGWHLATGDLIRATGEIPRADPFLAALTARRWVSDQWGADVLLSWLFAKGGFPLLYAMAVLAHLAVYTFIYRHCVLSSGSRIAGFAAAFLAFKVSLVHFILRPVLLGIGLFAIVFVLLRQLYVRLSEEGSFDWRRAGCIVALFVLWANVHPSFALGLVVVWIVPFAAAADAILLDREHLHGRTALLLGLAGCCTLVTLCNPNGLDLHTSIVALSQSDYFMAYHDEWLPMKAHSPESNLFKVSLLVLVLGLAAGIAKAMRWGFFELLLLGSFFSFAFDAVRGVPFWGIVVAPYLAQSLSAIASMLPEGVARWFPTRTAAVERFRFLSHGAITYVTLVVLVLVSVALKGAIPLYTGVYGPDAKKFPVQAMEFLRARPVGETIVFAPAHWGGYITWDGARGGEGSRVRAIIDDRNTMLGEAFYKEYHKTLESVSGWQSFPKAYGARYLLWPKESSFAKRVLAGEGKPPLYEDSTAIIVEIP